MLVCVVSSIGLGRFDGGVECHVQRQSVNTAYENNANQLMILKKQNPTIAIVSDVGSKNYQAKKGLLVGSCINDL